MVVHPNIPSLAARGSAALAALPLLGLAVTLIVAAAALGGAALP